MQYYYGFHIKESVLSTPPEMHRIIPAGGQLPGATGRGGIIADQNIGEGGDLPRIRASVTRTGYHLRDCCRGQSLGRPA